MSRFVAVLQYTLQVGPDHWVHDRVARSFDVDTPVQEVLTWAASIYATRPGWPDHHRPCLAEVMLTDLAEDAP